MMNEITKSKKSGCISDDLSKNEIQPNLFGYNRFKLTIATIIVIFMVYGIQAGLRYAKKTGLEKISELTDSAKVDVPLENEYGESPDDTITYRTDDNNCKQLIYVTYTKFNPKTGQTYVGKTQGCGNVENIVKQRDRYHHRNPEGFLPAVVDRTTYDYLVVRGREQQMIDYYGGAWSDRKEDGKLTKCGNKIRAVAKKHRNGKLYHRAASLAYSEIAVYTGY